MRIIGGIAAGTILKVPKGFDVRPTADLVRQALFNSLGARVAGARVLELFGGTGALSLECLSRGAERAVCVEKSPRHARFIRENLELARLPAADLDVRAQDAFTVLGRFAASSQQFDLILADPPYGEKNIDRRSTSFAQQLLDHEDLPRLLGREGLFILGHARRDAVSIPSAWQEAKMLKHGDTVMRFLQHPTAGEEADESGETLSESSPPRPETAFHGGDASPRRPDQDQLGGSPPSDASARRPYHEEVRSQYP